MLTAVGTPVNCCCCYADVTYLCLDYGCIVVVAVVVAVARIAVIDVIAVASLPSVNTANNSRPTAKKQFCF